MIKMRAAFSAFIILLSSVGYAQLDTVKISSHSMEKTTATVKRKKVETYTIDNVKVTQQKYDSVKKSADQAIAKCRPCWLKTYDGHGQIMTEGLSYTDCSLGTFIKYYPTGQVEMYANYKTNETGDWDKFKERGFCSVKEGTWLYYKEDGTIAKVEGYENGKLIK
jgi:antitoxin component YwqK of YwqJK toxin-antitoxin module